MGTPVVSQTVLPPEPGAATNPWTVECPPDGGMAGLIECYDNVNNASAFIAALMIDQINNNPAVTDAIIAAINKNGSALPLLGTTNGTPAVSPQVGQYIQLVGTLDYTSTVTSALLSLGVLPVGDWDCWLWATFTSTAITGAQYSLNPLPAGFAANPFASNYAATWPGNAILSSMVVEALTSGDSLIVADTSVAATSGSSGVMTVNFAARRRR